MQATKRIVVIKNKSLRMIAGGIAGFIACYSAYSLMNYLLDGQKFFSWHNLIMSGVIGVVIYIVLWIFMKKKSVNKVD